MAFSIRELIEMPVTAAFSLKRLLVSLETKMCKCSFDDRMIICITYNHEVVNKYFQDVLLSLLFYLQEKKIESLL